MCPHFICDRNRCRLVWDKPSDNSLKNHCLTEDGWLNACLIFNDNDKNPTLNSERERAEKKRKENERKEWLKTEDGKKWIAGEQEAFEKLINSAQQGDVVSQYELGIKYFNGNYEIEIKKDEKKAFEYIIKAAKHGNKEAKKWLNKKKINKIFRIIGLIIGIVVILIIILMILSMFI